MSFVIRSMCRRGVARWLGFVLSTLHVTGAFAQGTSGGGSTGGSSTGGGAPSTGGAGGPTSTTTVQGNPTYQFFPGGVAPTPPGSVLGGGNAQYSSSKPITGNERDGFDFKGGGGGQGTVRGDANSSFVIGGGASREVFAGPVPSSHAVRRGDTLWGICDFYFHNPYQWPRIWSYNAQIRNPHWIYPGDQVKLQSGADVGVGTEAGPAGGPKGAITDRRRQVGPDTIFLRNEGFIEDESITWGEINGAREEKMFLSDYDEVYLRIGSNHDVKIGQELTVFRPIKKVGDGKLVEIQGTVKVDQWNAKEHIARARITESLDTIERGARVAPMTRRFEVVAPVRNDNDVTASVVTSVHPHEVYGQNQVVFLDRGEDEGLKPGNRLFVIRKGDGYHATAPSNAASQRIAIESESPGAMETIRKPRSDAALPEEVMAELRIISVKKGSSMALVTASRREIEIGDKAYARKGY